MTPPLLSLCMIVKDEADQIEACLTSVYAVVDEIIVVDTGSTDGPKSFVANTEQKSSRCRGKTAFPKGATSA